MCGKVGLLRLWNQHRHKHRAFSPWVNKLVPSRFQRFSMRCFICAVVSIVSDSSWRKTRCDYHHLRHQQKKIKNKSVRWHFSEAYGNGWRKNVVKRYSDQSSRGQISRHGSRRWHLLHHQLEQRQPFRRTWKCHVWTSVLLLRAKAYETESVFLANQE